MSVSIEQLRADLATAEARVKELETDEQCLIVDRDALKHQRDIAMSRLRVVTEAADEMRRIIGITDADVRNWASTDEIDAAIAAYDAAKSGELPPHPALAATDADVARLKELSEKWAMDAARESERADQAEARVEELTDEHTELAGKLDMAWHRAEKAEARVKELTDEHTELAGKLGTAWHRAEVESQLAYLRSLPAYAETPPEALVTRDLRRKVRK